jgi:hypothetical protein
VTAGVLTAVQRALSEIQGAYTFSDQADGRGSHSAARRIFEEQRTQIAGYLSAISGLTSGQVQAVSLGTLNGRAMTHTADDLRFLDRVLRASLTVGSSEASAERATLQTSLFQRELAPRAIPQSLIRNLPFIAEVGAFLVGSSVLLDQPIAPDMSRGCDALIDELATLDNALRPIIRAIIATQSLGRLIELLTIEEQIMAVVEAQRPLLQDCYRNEVGNQIESFTNSLNTSIGGATTGGPPSSGNGRPLLSQVVNPPPLSPGTAWPSPLQPPAPGQADSGPLADLIRSGVK